MTRALAITLGDPAGIGSEVVFSALAALEERPPIRLFGEWAWTEGLVPDALRGALHVTTAESEPAGELAPGAIEFVDTAMSRGAPLRWGEVDALCGSIALASIEAAARAIETGLCAGLVTAPIHKRAIHLAGSQHPGHTEILATRFGLTQYGRDYAMYFDSPSLRVALLSVHEPLREAIARIEAMKIAELAMLANLFFWRIEERAPVIAVAGVNPHAGEEGLFGREELVIARGVEQARALGLDISGPHPADTVFGLATRGMYDLVIAMYHDQGLIPVKTLAFETSVNVTIGLPFLRCSVDHGTAFDIAGRGVANQRPMLHTIRWAMRNLERWHKT